MGTGKDVAPMKCTKELGVRFLFDQIGIGGHQGLAFRPGQYIVHNLADIVVNDNIDKVTTYDGGLGCELHFAGCCGVTGIPLVVHHSYYDYLIVILVCCWWVVFVGHCPRFRCRTGDALVFFLVLWLGQYQTRSLTH